jgi:hypothetical protein
MKFVVKPARRGRNCLHFGGAWTAVFGALVLSLSISLVASEKEAITVKSSSVNKGVVSANAEMQGKVVQLLCYTSAPDCQIPKDGDYLLLRAPSGKGRYMDCPNIDLYEKSAFRKQGKKIGEYCLLGNEP